jgi:hypothetical protein
MYTWCLTAGLFFIIWSLWVTRLLAWTLTEPLGKLGLIFKK